MVWREGNLLAENGIVVLQHSVREALEESCYAGAGDD